MITCWFADGFKKLALHYAAESGNLKQVKWYFQMGVKLSQADVDLLLSFNLSRVMESTILRQLEAMDIQNYHFPTSMHNIDENDECYDPGVSTFVLVKLQRVTDDTAGRLHQLPLHRATMFGNIRAVELLLDEGADPNARDANRWTPLHYCADEATSNHLAIAQLLMENSKMVDIDARSLKGRSPLHVAARSKKRKMLCDENVSPSAEECEANRRKLFVDYLIEHRANLDLKDSRGSTPLLLACQSDYVGVIKSLLDAGCDPTIVSDNKWNPLHLAVIQGKPSMVLFLMSWDADSRLWINSIDQQGRKPIDITKNDCTRQMLMILGYIDVLQSTEASTLPAPSRGRHPKQASLFELKRTAPGRFLQVAVLLLQAGADLCAGDKWGITPLMLAATINDSIFMETLLDRLPDENDLIVVDEDGNTALHYSYAFCQV
ncbi:unnamed protein product [Phytophthora lilii]|uniref:Unnamed protein product n=1 Tax=Phytophthora lilii TaxID=2077276 RepID=A0A9W6WPR0_9STRA|nr:unnamed protein product [Phytophthora lilii]